MDSYGIRSALRQEQQKFVGIMQTSAAESLAPASTLARVASESYGRCMYLENLLIEREEDSA